MSTTDWMWPSSGLDNNSLPNVAKQNVNPMTTRFPVQDLNDSTFIFPANNLVNTNDLPFPELNRGFSSNSFSNNINNNNINTMLPGTPSNNNNINNNNNPELLDINNIPGPSTPLRGLSNLEMGLGDVSNLSANPYINGNTNINPSGNYDFGIPENFMSAVQATNTNSNQFQMAMNYPNLNPNDFNLLINTNNNNTTNNISLNNNNNFNPNSANTPNNINNNNIVDEPSRKRARAIDNAANTSPNSGNLAQDLQQILLQNRNNPQSNNNFSTIPPVQLAVAANTTTTKGNKNNPKLQHSNSQQRSGSDEDDIYDEPKNNNNNMMLYEDADKETQKKIKHQMTDRQRRAKIKESMDALKALVPLESNQKADQATVVAKSVEHIHGLTDEVAALRARIKQLELSAATSNNNNASYSINPEFLKNAGPNSPFFNQYSNSPYSSMMASLNGAGVAMWRVALDGKIAEVNMVFEMITGFAASEIVGKSPCSAPLYGNLSIMPQSFLRHFSTVSALVAQPITSANSTTTASTSSTNSSVNHNQNSNTINIPSSPSDSVNSNDEPHRLQSPIPSPGSGVVTATAQGQPLFTNSTISTLPIVPQSELQSFFPYKHKSLLDLDNSNSNSTSNTSNISQIANSTRPTNPQPHGTYLINHLANLPANHVLKLLSRTNTSFGDTLEAIVTISLVRSYDGKPDYVLILSTPDARRLVKPNHFLRAQSPNDCMRLDQPIVVPQQNTAKAW